MRFAAGFVGMVAALALCSSAGAADGADPPEVQALANQFFGKLKSGDNAGAFQTAFKDSGITPPTSLQGIAATTGGLLTTFGGIVDWSPVRKADNIDDIYSRDVLCQNGRATPILYDHVL